MEQHQPNPSQVNSEPPPKLHGVRVTFFSYFQDLTGCAEDCIEVPVHARISELLECVYDRYPRMRAMARSTLIAVGVEYQSRDYILQPGDEVSLFPPVQGG